MQRRRCLVLIIISLGFILPAQMACGSATRGLRPVDIRVVIVTHPDAKQADDSKSPAKSPGLIAQQQALALLIRLLPNGSQLGLWQAAKEPKAIMPLATVSATYKTKAIEAVQSVSGRAATADGLVKTIKAASSDWLPDPQAKRAIILLVDGKLPMLSNHRSALTKAFAGHRLYVLPNSTDSAKTWQYLAEKTRGYYQPQTAPLASQLAMTTILDRVADVSELPIRANRVLVDPATHVLQLVLFHGHKVALQLKSPDRRLLSPSELPFNVTWQQHKHYDVVTVNYPTPGQWEVMGDFTENSRAFAQTRLHLSVSGLPNSVYLGQDLPVSVTLKQGDTITNDPAIMQDLKITMALMNEHHHGETITFFKAWPGRYYLKKNLNHTQEVNFFDPGDYQVQVVAQSPTFVRRKTYPVKVYARPVAISQEINALTGRHRIELQPITELVDSNSLTIKALITKPALYAGQRTLEVDPQRSSWGLSLKPLAKGSSYRVIFTVAGKQHNGHPFDIQLHPISVAQKVTPQFIYFGQAKKTLFNAIHQATRSYLALPSFYFSRKTSYALIRIYKRQQTVKQSVLNKRMKYQLKREKKRLEKMAEKHTGLKQEMLDLETKLKVDGLSVFLPLLLTLAALMGMLLAGYLFWRKIISAKVKKLKGKLAG